VTHDTSDPRSLVLIVDDNTDHLEFLRAAASSGYRVLVASNGLDAYTIACDQHPDVILLDLVMPVANGQTVVRKLRANPATAAVPIIAVTGLETATVEALPERGDFSVVLKKPCHQGEILEAIRKAASSPREPITSGKSRD